jgi:hypothetical protein
MLPDYYRINTILSPIHEFVITMLDYYRIDITRLHDDNSQKRIVEGYKLVIVLGLFTIPDVISWISHNDTELLWIDIIPLHDDKSQNAL